MNFRIGFGYDVHQLKEGNDFFIGGVKLDHYKGADGHSDADVLIHAICDAILGAANLRDIGHHFSDTDPSYKGIDSKILLQDVMVLIRKEGFEINNIDSTVCLEKPKLHSYIPLMQATLSKCMRVNLDQLSIKATTSERMGFIGKENGISAYVVVLLSKNQKY
jgi:2-C-methyl-D-erythritol 2,4-cyclodiphosphate synthase